MKQFEKVLAIETSCDDTSVAIVSHDGFVLAQRSADQNLAHERFGGVVPEIACRNHTFNLLPLVDEVLKSSHLQIKDLSGIAVTSEPGLIGSLLVGLVSAKTLALVNDLKFIGVNHLEGHLLAPFLKDATYAPPQDFKYPYIALAISGGHSSLYLIKDFGKYEVLGNTRDDAAGEAFDKFAKLLGLGFPGGVHVDRLAQGGDVKAFSFPRPLIRETHFDFSFSGLKSSALRLVSAFSAEDRAQLDAQASLWLKRGASDAARKIQGDDLKDFSLLSNLCASYQEAIVDVLVERLFRAAEKFNLNRVVVTGGVSANSRLRARVQEEARVRACQIVIPPIRYCTDNAAMIGLAGIIRLNRGEFSGQELSPKARSPLGSRYVSV